MKTINGKALLVLLVSEIIVVAYGFQYIITRFDSDIPSVDSVTGTPYKNCGGSKRSTLKNVEVTPCEVKDRDACVFKRGSNVTFSMSFISKENSQTLKTKIYGIIDYIPVPFPCPQPNACKDSGVSCPIVKGQFYNYTLSAPVLQKYPKTSLWIKGELRDDNGNNLVCVEVPIKIV